MLLRIRQGCGCLDGGLDLAFANTGPGTPGAYPPTRWRATSAPAASNNQDAGHTKKESPIGHQVHGISEDEFKPS